MGNCVLVRQKLHEFTRRAVQLMTVPNDTLKESKNDDYAKQVYHSGNTDAGYSRKIETDHEESSRRSEGVVAGAAMYDALNGGDVEAIQKLFDEQSSRRSEGVVAAVYDALNVGDVEAIHKLFAADLDWWFNGPPSHQFLMQLLTDGKASESESDFHFVPHGIFAFGTTVLTEGWEESRSFAWVHAWTVTDDGVIVQVREYVNVSVTVMRIGNTTDQSDGAIPPQQHCPSVVWESRMQDRVGKSVPGHIIVI